MLTRKLRLAYQETEKLVEFLEKREWDNSTELLSILDRADLDIDGIVTKAISEVLIKLQGSYSQEAETWSRNEMTNISGAPIKISASEQKKALTTFNKINKTVEKLFDIL